MKKILVFLAEKKMLYHIFIKKIMQRYCGVVCNYNNSNLTVQSTQAEKAKMTSWEIEQKRSHFRILLDEHNNTSELLCNYNLPITIAGQYDHYNHKPTMLLRWKEITDFEKMNILKSYLNIETIVYTDMEPWQCFTSYDNLDLVICQLHNLCSNIQNDSHQLLERHTIMKTYKKRTVSFFIISEGINVGKILAAKIF